MQRATTIKLAFSLAKGTATMMQKYLQNFYLTLVYIFLYLPIVVIICFSFNISSHSLLWHGFTWHWYHVLFHDSDLAWVVVHSLTIGLLAASFGTLLGTLAAVSLFRYQFFGKSFLNGLLFILIIIPDLVFGIALLLFFTSIHLSLGFWTLLLAHITFCIPFVFVTVSSRMGILNKHFIEAGRDLGASEITIFKRILIPLLAPAILVGWLLSFTLSFDDVVISYFVTGPSFEILPLKIYSMIRLGVKPEINALCSVLLVFTLIIIVTASHFMKNPKSKNGKQHV